MIVEATDLPVNADFEAGFARDAKGVAKNVTRCVETGVAALSIEDSTGDKAKPLYDLSEAVERLKAAREAIDASKDRRAPCRPRRVLPRRPCRAAEGGQPISTFTNFGATAFTIAPMSSRVRTPGA